MLNSTSTGSPSNNVGEYRHWRTASNAATASSGAGAVSKTA